MEETTVFERSGDMEVMGAIDTDWFIGPPMELMGGSLILCVDEEVGVWGPGPRTLFS